MGQGRKRKNSAKKQRSRRKAAIAKRRRKRKAQLQRPQGAYAASDEPVQLMGNKADWLRLGSRIRTMVKNEGLARLARVREMIAADANLPMLPIRIVPFGWMNPERNGVIFGQANIIQMKRCFQWGVIVPASTLVIVDDDDILRRIVCHEFAHCLWYIAQVIREMKNGKWTSIESADHLTQKQLFDEQVKKDKNELVDPNRWFGEWDVKHFLPEGRGALDEATKLFAERWFKLELPIQVPDMKFDFKVKMSIPDEIGEHVRKLDVEADSTN